jgi:hypothetical protein
MGPPVHTEPFQLEFCVHESAGGVGDVGAKLRCVQLSLSTPQHAQPVLYLLLLGQGLSVPGVGGGAGGAGEGFGFPGSSGFGGFPAICLPPHGIERASV